jgi:hypothetical protein
MLLDELRVPRDGGVVTLTNASTGQALYKGHTAERCGAREAGCAWHAKVHLASLPGPASAAGSAKPPAAAAAAAPKRNLGRGLRISVRRPSGETVSVKTYQKEPLRAVLDGFLSQLASSGSAGKKQPKTAWKLVFDGKVVDLDSDTPEGLDMDDEDLVDAVEK